MRHFSSYGPVNPMKHYAVARTALVERCVSDLVGDPEEAGHYFTIWGPRQTGKTWLMRRAMQEIRARYGDAFLVKELSMQGVSLQATEGSEAFLAQVPGLFKTSNIPFSFDDDWCNYLYLNGVITYEEVQDRAGRPLRVCRFSSPFIQHRLYNAFSRDMAALGSLVPPVDPQTDLTQILQTLDLPALLAHYRDYLRRAKQAGHNPFQGHPTRSDLHLREAVGHFHLDWWLTQSCAGLYTITPEFPTGNGKVDLHIRYDDRSAVIEVKSFTTKAELPQQKQQAARYARRQGLPGSTLALFVPAVDEALLASLTTDETLPVDGHDIRVTTVAIAAQ